MINSHFIPSRRMIWARGLSRRPFFAAGSYLCKPEKRRRRFDAFLQPSALPFSPRWNQHEPSPGLKWIQTPPPPCDELFGHARRSDPASDPQTSPPDRAPRGAQAPQRAQVARAFCSGLALLEDLLRLPTALAALEASGLAEATARVSACSVGGP